MSVTPVMEILVVHWIWTDGPHKDASFWAAHSTGNDGRLRDWPKHNMAPLGAAKITIIDGEGLDLIPPAAARES